MIEFEYPDGASDFDAAAFSQAGDLLMSGHREECEQAAIDANGLYCVWVNGRPVIRADFEREPEPGICNWCNGSGEGQHEGTTCTLCKGSGECSSQL